MILTSKPLAVFLFVFLFGGIAISSVMGWWATESTKEPATFTEGEFAGLANPADIRGSYTFGDIANSFDVTPEILAQAFGIATDTPAAFAVKELEALYLDSGFEIGTNSVRMFVAFYTGLPFDLTAEETVLPQAATDILLAEGNLTPEQVTYLETHTVTVNETAVVAEPAVVETPVSEESEYVVKGKTTFGDLMTWGVPKETVETLIGTSMPDPAMKVKDYASANGLDFETLKTALQAEVDKVKP
ncbi:MAG: hypothetical protein IPG80_06920 [Anaerolineales bacterium]|uniref:hypothetical protein n=1 Tax=Candidatus Villigracilis vicinus TaxID=3140679 RepID=UPI003135A6E3|nr:hypothetical protein [Anaerolineales bacterium]MBK7450086.1 hypothetical protein [Anaerolineales bacterium]